MTKSMTAWILAAAFTAFAFVAHAIDRDFTIHNNIGATINNLYISPHSSSRWGPDQLGNDVIANGAAWTFHFHPGNFRGVCVFDLKLVEPDNTEHVVNSLNLCTITDVNFTREGDNVVAHTTP
jgi:hypothetical protein